MSTSSSLLKSNNSSSEHLVTGQFHVWAGPVRRTLQRRGSCTVAGALMQLQYTAYVTHTWPGAIPGMQTEEGSRDYRAQGISWVKGSVCFPPFSPPLPSGVQILYTKRVKQVIWFAFSSFTFGARDLKPSRGGRPWSDLAPHVTSCDQV